MSLVNPISAAAVLVAAGRFLDSSSSTMSLSLASTMVDIAGVRLHKRLSDIVFEEKNTIEKEVVITSTSLVNLRRLAFAFSLSHTLGRSGRPILLEGPSGSGKTTLLRFIARSLGFLKDMVELHLDDSTDGKSLLGTYVCTDVPGEFKWQPGAVTSAAVSGRWLLIEDIDRAPFDVLASLGSLLESRTLVLPGRAKIIHAHPNFQLFATRSCAYVHNQHYLLQSVNGALSAFVDRWLRVPFILLGSSIDNVNRAALEKLSLSTSREKEDEEIKESGKTFSGSGSNELLFLLTSLFPSLPPFGVLDHIMACHDQLERAFNCSSSALSKHDVKLCSFPLSLERFGRNFSARDVIRWALRVEKLTSLSRRQIMSPELRSGGAASMPTNHPVFLTESEKLAIVNEGISVISSHIPSSDIRRSVARALGSLWGLSIDAVDESIDSRKPSVSYSFGASSSMHLTVGDIVLLIEPKSPPHASFSLGRTPQPLPIGFAPTRHSMNLLERLAACVCLDEPALLVGETGNGKTSVIQALAYASGKQLLVYNLNVQSDSADLVGGFKPVHLRQIAVPLLQKFENLFLSTFQESAPNQSFIEIIKKAVYSDDWAKTIGGFMRALQRAHEQTQMTAQLKSEWVTFNSGVKNFERQYRSSIKLAEKNDADSSIETKRATFAFSFVDGVLVQALRQGHWLLLDEINLASAETLQRLAGLLEGGSVTLTEKVEADPVPRHPNFRLFAAMNPATDFGKRNLPPALRARFSEIYVPDVEAEDDLSTIVSQYISNWPSSRSQSASSNNGNSTSLIGKIVSFYLQVRRLSAPVTGCLRDGASSRPHYSLRSLTRSLQAATILIEAGFEAQRACKEGMCAFFVTQLEESSAKVVLDTMRQYFGGNTSSVATLSTTSTTVTTGKKKDNKQSQLALDLIARLGGSGGGGGSNISTQFDDNDSEFSMTNIPRPRGLTGKDEDYILSNGFWLHRGPNIPINLAEPDKASGAIHYVLVPSVKRHLRSLSRAVACQRFPVLLQGPTSAGKTSMIEYLAKATGHECVRINNHEHTDIAEYIGSYASTSQGRLEFSEGLLVKALRRGYWLILDELNLAPSEVLEALNRLLDDNRELFIPETQETVRPHPNFILFATQNPAGAAYGGRKPLSLAFRNRFIELHIDDIPSAELHTIIIMRSRLPSTFVEKMVSVMQELQRLRQGSDVFAGRHGFITPRDLLRWAQRQPRTFQSLAEEGFALLGERLRISSERDTVKFVLESVCKVVINLQDLYDAPFSITNTENSTSLVGSKRSSSRVDGDAPKRARLSVSVKSTDDDSTSAAEAKEVMQNRLQSFLSFRREMRRTGLEPVGVNSNLKPGSVPGTEGLSSLTVTRSLRRLFDLVGRCIANDEPVLLVGDTGCGKTTVIQLFALLLQHPLHVINCHVHTETADILGSLRPVRSHASSALFEWSDGPLVQAMQNGDFFLLDEASLAEDAVLERLNSVLEPSRSLTLAEKADTGSGAEGGDSRSIKAASSFRIFATMNPGGDFGKRELSPALRNRFTEIWVPALSSDDDKDGEDTDLRLIIAEKAADVFSSSLFRTTPSNLNPLTQFVDPIVRFVKWFEQNASHGLLATLDEKKNTNSTTERGSRVFQLTLRDLHSWLAFMGATLLLPTSTVSPWEAYAHGACLVLLDGLGLGMGLSQEACERIRNGAAKEISQHAPLLERSVVDAVLWPNRIAPIQNETPLRNNMFGVMPFFIPTGSHSPPSKVSFALEAPTTRSNLVRVLRALQLRRPVLLEGSPGVGKTSLIEAIARQSGHKLVRINLSDQTDVSDLFGQDLPSSNIANDSIGGGSGSKFAWCDGVFLQALRNGDWVLLDELNLAPQAVLESLNAVLDHRGTVYIPELNQTFPCAPGFQVFATQNPVAQGGGRKGLPKSFLNRFAKVYVESLTTYDQLFIARSIFPQLDVPIKYPLGGTCGESPDSTTLVLMTKYCEALHTDTMGHPCLYGQEGRPWEFNLRDLFRWCDLIISTQTGPNWDPGAAVEHVLWTRLRSLSDRAAAAARFISIFGSSIGDAESSPQSSRRIASLITLHSTPSLRLTDRFFAINDVVVPRAALRGSWEPSSIDSNVSLKVGKQLALKLLESTSRSDISIARDYEDRKNKGSSIVGPLSPSLLYSMYHCAQAVVSSSPVLLVGRRSTGKSATLVHLAQLCGARLRIVPLTPSTDATELVGCFEQADPKRRLDEVLDAATGLVHGFLAALSALELHGDITSMTHERIISVSTSLREHTASQISLSNVELILSILEASKDIIYNESFTGRIASVRTQALAVQSAVDNISAERGSFEWVDGTLVEAMERGEWVVVENVNFCAASVVDRLNPMLEPGGSLLISECGLDASGMPRIIRASPSFRIFFTLDPSLGDVSRALRNRCVEIALTSPDENLGTGKGNVSAAAKLAVDKVFSTTSSSTPVYRAAQIISSRITASNSRVDNTRVFALSSADENDGPLLATVAKGAVEAHESAIQSAVLSSTAPPRFRQLVYLGDALRALSQIHSKSTSKILFLEDALIAFDLIYRNYSSTETARNALASSLFNMQTLPSIGLPSLLELAPVSAVQKNTSDLEPLLPLLLAIANPQDSHSIGALFFIAGAGEGEIHEIAHSRWIVDIAREFLSRVPLTSVTAVRDRLHAFNKLLISSQIPDILRVPGLSFSSAFAAQIETFKIVDGDVPQILSLLPVDFNSAPHLWKYLDVIVRQSGTGVNLMDIKRFCSRLLLCSEESGDVAMRTSEIESSISLQSTSVTAIALAITLAQRLGLPLPSSFSLLTTSSQFTARSLERYLGGQSLALVASVCESIRAASFMALQSPAIADRDISFLVKVRDACRRIHQLLLRTKVSIAAESLSVPLEHPNLAPTIFILWRRVVKSLRRSWYVLLGVLSQGQQNSLLSSTYQCTLALNNSSDASESSIESLNHNIKPEDLLERALHKPLDFLWRFGGHPGISRSSETFKSSQSIFNLLTELKETIAVPPVRTEDRLAEGYEGRGLRSLDIVGGSTRADILGLVGTIHIVSSDLSAPLQTIKASLSASEDILVSVRQIVTARTPPLPEIGEGLEDGDMDTDEGDGSGGRTSLGVDAPLLTRLHLSALSGVLMRRAVLLQPALAEATELHCLVEERMLIASLHNLMIRESGFTLPDNDFLLPIESLISRVNRVIAISLAATRWNPSDLLPLRVVSWILNDPKGCMLQRLRDIVPSLSASWHSRAEDAKLYDHDAARLYQNSYADSSQICSRSVDALVRRSCALYAFESRTYSLQLLASHCSTNIEVSQNVAKASRTVAISQFLILLLSAEWIFTQSSKEMQQEYRQDVKAWWEEVVVFGRVDHFNPFRILESLKKGQDSRIRTLLPPTSNLFAVTLEAAGRAFEQNINTQDLSIRAFTFSTRVAQLRYLLLLPSSPVDPALKPALKRAELEKNCTEKRGELALRQLTRVLTLGESYISLVDLQSLSQSSDEKISSYAVELQSAEPLRTKYISREVFRPSEQSLNCSFSVVYAESRGFARNMLSSERIDGALMRLTNLQSNDNSATEAQAWASAAQSFAQRLRSFFSVFKDIADPLMVAISDMACAKRSLALIKSQSFAKSPLHHMEIVPSSTQTTVSTGMAAVSLLQVRTMQVEKKARDALSGLISVHYSSHDKNELVINSQKSNTSFLIGETTEEREAREFREVIPDHFKTHFGEFARSPQEMLTDYKAPEAKSDMFDAVSSDSISTKTMKATPRALAEEYIKLFGGSSNGLPRLPSDDGLSYDRLWSMSMSSPLAPISSKSMPRLLYELSVMSSRYSIITQDVHAEPNENFGYNYYRDTNLSESTLAIRPARDFAGRCYELLQTFPSNEVLAMLLRVTDQFLRLPASAPVALLLSGAQLIVTKAQEWEVNAPALYQIGPQLITMSQLVTRWRKLELSSWSKLLLSANGEQRESAAQLFFLLRSAFLETPNEVIDFIRNNLPENGQSCSKKFQKLLPALGSVFSEGNVGIPHHAAWAVQVRTRNATRLGVNSSSATSLLDVTSVLDTHLRSCFEAADRFVRASPKGQFRVRLQLLGSLSEELISHNLSDPLLQQIRLRLSIIARNVRSFYSQYIDAVQISIDESSRPVLKTVHDQATIHRWDEQSYYALRESAEKSHKIVFHALRDYRLVLAESIGPVIEEFSAGKVSEAGPSPAINKAIKSRKKKPLSAISSTLSDSLLDIRNAAVVKLKSVLLQESTEKEGKAIPLEIIQSSSLSLPAIRRRMLQLLTRGARGLCSKDAIRVRDLNIESIENFSLSIFHVIDELSELTEPLPSSLNKDSVKKSAPGGSSRMMKQRALTNTLRGMSRLGLSPLSSSVSPKQSEFIELMQVPSLYQTSFVNSGSGSASACLQSADEYYFRSLDEVLRLRLRLASGDWHKDLAQSDVRKGVGFMEHLISLMLQQRGMIRASYVQVSGLSLFLKQLEESSSIDKSVISTSFLFAKASLTTSEEAESALSDAVALLSGGKTLLKSLARTSAAAVSSSSTDTLTMFTNDVVSDEAVLSGLLFSHQQRLSDLGPALTSRMSALSSQFDSIESCLKIVQAARHSLEASLPRHGDISAATLTLHCDGRVQSSSDVPSFFEKLTISNDSVQKVCEAVDAAQTQVKSILEIENGAAGCQILLLKAFSIDVLTRLRIRLSSVSESLTSLNLPNATCSLVESISKDIRSSSCELIKEAMLAVQSLSMTSGSSDSTRSIWGLDLSKSTTLVDESDTNELLNDDEEETSVNLAAITLQMFDTLDAAQLPVLALATAQVVHSIEKSFKEDTDSISHAAALARGVLEAHRCVELDAIRMHKATCKLALVVGASLLRLMKDGFCSPPDAEEGEAGEDAGEGGNKGEGKFHAGTGIGEGKGQKDVSDQIENEEQVLGLKGDDEKQASSGPQDKSEEKDDKERKNGLEMQSDFAGDLFDISEEENDEGDKDEKKDNEEEEDADREMGKADGNNSRIVDEKLWNGSDDENNNSASDVDSPEQAKSSVTGGKDRGMRAKKGEDKETSHEEQGSANPDDLEHVDDVGEVEERENENEGAAAPPNEEEEGTDIDVAGELGDYSGDEDMNDVDDQDGNKEPEKDDEKPEGAEGQQHKSKAKSTREDALQDEDEEFKEEVQGENKADDMTGKDPAEDAIPEGLDEDLPTEMNFEGAAEDNDQEPDDNNMNQEEDRNDERKADTNENDPDSSDNVNMGENLDSTDAAQVIEGEEPIEQPKGQNEAPPSTSAQGLASRGGESRVTGEESNAQKAGDTSEISLDSVNKDAHDEINHQSDSKIEDNNAAEEDFDMGDDAPGGADGTGENQEKGSWRRKESSSGSQQEVAPRKRTAGPNKPNKSLRPDLNPLKNPELALKHWQARLHESLEGEEGGGEADDTNADNDDFALQSNDVDVVANSSGRAPMLAPRETTQPDAHTAKTNNEAIEKGQSDHEGDKALSSDLDEVRMDESSDEKLDLQDESDDKDLDVGKFPARERKRDPSGALASSSKNVSSRSDKDTENNVDESMETSALESDRFMKDILDRNQTSSGTTLAQNESKAITGSVIRDNESRFDLIKDIDSHNILDSSPEILRKAYETLLASWSLSGVDRSLAADAWSALSALTAAPAARLCESLRLALEPTLASKLGGEFRVGKRINMRRVIPYIASNFRKDKIWMRRSKPSKRTYQVLLAIDDSLSMAPANRGGGGVAVEAMAVLARALSRLEAGEIGIMSYGKTVSLLHPFDQPFDDIAGARCLSQFTFTQESTRTDSLLEACTRAMEDARSASCARAGGSLTGVKCMQLVFIISDGIVGTGPERERVRQWVIEASKKGLLIVLVIVDKSSSSLRSEQQHLGVSSAVSQSLKDASDRESITAAQSVRFEGGQVVRTPYLANYPFPFYVVVKGDAGSTLPDVLGTAVRKWISMVNESNYD